MTAAGWASILPCWRPGKHETSVPRLHIAYCPGGRARLRIDDETYDLDADGGLKIERSKEGVAACLTGLIVLGSVTSVALNRT